MNSGFLFNYKIFYPNVTSALLITFLILKVKKKKKIVIINQSPSLPPSQNTRYPQTKTSGGQFRNFLTLDASPEESMSRLPSTSSSISFPHFSHSLSLSLYLSSRYSHSSLHSFFSSIPLFVLPLSAKQNLKILAGAKMLRTTANSSSP